MRYRSAALALTVSLTPLAVAACGSGGGGDATPKKTGPITIWLSNNKQEVQWGRDMVAAWNAAHADQTVSAQEIPAGKSSEEVIGAAITAGNAPCLIFNVAPAAVPGFQKQGGLVALDGLGDAAAYLAERNGAGATSYRSPDGKYYQLPWKANPVVIMYNKAIFTKAGLDPEKPRLSTYAEFMAAGKKIVETKAAQAAIWPSPTSEFYQSWFDFMPLFAAQSKGMQLVMDAKSTFAGADGMAVADFWSGMYRSKLAPQERYNGDALVDGKAAMAITGPWAVAAYKGKVNVGVSPIPTLTGMAAGQTYTFADSKNVSVFSACQAPATAWEVLKFATSKEQDGKLLDLTGQMPLRKNLTTTYPEYFAKNPQYTFFADQASRTVDVPNVPNSIEIWQTFRDAYSTSVIFGKSPAAEALKSAATKIDTLAKG